MVAAIVIFIISIYPKTISRDSAKTSSQSHLNRVHCSTNFQKQTRRRITGWTRYDASMGCNGSQQLKVIHVIQEYISKSYTRIHLLARECLQPIVPTSQTAPEKSTGKRPHLPEGLRGRFPDCLLYLLKEILDTNLVSNLQYAHVCLFSKNISKDFPLSNSNATGRSLRFMLGPPGVSLGRHPPQLF